MDNLPLAADIMNRSVHCIESVQPIDTAIRVLLNHGFSGAPVVDTEGRLCGVLSEKDCMRVLASAAFYGMPEGVVASHMTRDVISVGPDADLFRIVFMFHSNEVRRIPVVEDGKVVGLITRRDTLRALESLYQVRLKHGREPEEIARARSAV